jgi:hypothetical protein
VTDNGKPDRLAQDAVRDRLAEAGADAVERMILTLEEGLKAEKTVNADITCKACGEQRIYRVQVPDARAAASVFETWMNQGFGRPGAADTAEEQKTIVYYASICHCETCSCEDDGDPEVSKAKAWHAAQGHTEQ